MVSFCSSEHELSFSEDEAFSGNVEVAFDGIGVIARNNRLEDRSVNKVSE